jgi:hypothetical protein
MVSCDPPAVPHRARDLIDIFERVLADGGIFEVCVDDCLHGDAVWLLEQPDGGAELPAPLVLGEPVLRQSAAYCAAAVVAF